MGNRAGTRGSPGAGPELPGPQIQPGPQHLCQNTNQHPTPGSRRQTGLGMGSTLARVGSIVSPLVSMTAELYPSVPLFIYGAVPVAASAAITLLPETLGQPLPDTVQDVENRWAPIQ